MADNQIPIINPAGESGTIPANQLNDALGQGYRIPLPKMQLTDLSEDKSQVHVYSPTGESGVIPISQLDDAFRQGYLPKSFGNESDIKAHREKVAKTLAVIENSDELSKLHSSDKSLDSEGNVLLKTLDGRDLALPMKDAVPLLASRQVKFADPNFAALVDASKEQFKQTGAVSTAIGKAGKTIIPESVGSYLEEKTGDNISHAAFLAHRISDAENNYPTAAAIGTGIGLLGSLFTPEVGLAGKAEAAIAAKFGTGIIPTLGKGAIGSALIVSPQALAQAVIDKDLKGSIETLALGAGLGSGLSLLGKGAKALIASKLEGSLERAVTETGLPALDKGLAGTAEQQAGFLKKLGEEGLAESGKAEKTLSVLDKLAQGSALESAASKLSEVAEKVPATSIAAKIEQIGNDTIPLIRKGGEVDISRPVVAEFTNAVEKMADKSGNLSLSDVIKVAQEAGTKATDKEAGIFYQAVNDKLIEDAVKIGTDAVEKSDVKTASEWSQAVYNQRIAKALPRTLAEFESRTAATTGSKTEKDLIGKLLSKGVSLLSHKGIGTVIGAVGGHSTGIPGMGLVAGMVGHKVEEGVNKLAEAYINNPKNNSKMTGWLTKQKDNPALASYLIMDANAAHLAKLKEIPKVLEAPIVKASASNPIKELLGDHANGLSKPQQFNKLSGQLANLAANQEVRQAHLQELAAPLKDHPQVQSALVQDMENKIKYLYNVMPKNPNDPKPFTKEGEWQPTPAQLKEFEDTLRIAQDPYMLVENLKNGKLTEKQVATAAQLNPVILSHIRDEIRTAAYSGKVVLNNQQKLQASLLMGENMTAEMNKIQQLQSVYGGQQPQQGQSAPPSHKGSKTPTGLDKLPQAQPTTSQRIASK